MSSDIANWLLESDEPWTRYRTLLDLLGRTEEAPEVKTARQELLSHSFVKELVKEAFEYLGKKKQDEEVEVEETKICPNQNDTPVPISDCNLCTVREGCPAWE